MQTTDWKYKISSSRAYPPTRSARQLEFLKCINCNLEYDIFNLVYVSIFPKKFILLIMYTLIQ